MDIINSKDNVKVKEARKLLRKKYRDQSGQYLLEGFHLLEEAMNAEADFVVVFISDEKWLSGSYDYLLDKLGDKLLVVSKDILKMLTEEVTPQGIVAIVKKAPMNIKTTGKILVLENIQDPGNVGTMIRTSDAAGFDSVICVGNTADIYSPKVLRSAQGSHFHISVSICSDKIYDSLSPLFVTTLSVNSVDYRCVNADNFALVMGNEGAGVSKRALFCANKKIHIPMVGRAESLNVAVAAGILMFSI